MTTFYTHPLVQRKISSLKQLRHKRLLCGWGYKLSGKRAMLLSKLYKKPFYLFEDSPVRSLKPGYSGAVFGITIDSSGAMFDASGASDLVEKLQGEIKVSPHTPALIDQYIRTGASKYNWTLSQETSHYEQGILLIDQTKGDASLKYGGVAKEDFSRLFNDALNDFPNSPIYIKSHPDSFTNRSKKSCFTPAQLAHPRVKLLPPDLSPADCFNFCKTVYVGTSLIGIEALIHGCSVVSYGWNFYTGWGLTTDRGHTPKPPRNCTHTLEEIFQAAYVDYAHYFHPDTSEPCELSDILDHLEVQKRQWSKFQGSVVSYKANSWKRFLIDRYVKGPITQLKHHTNANSIPANSKVLIWGTKQAPKLPTNCSVVRVEDGFIRSNGLGAKFTFPLSWVFDDVGIYFDARSPSRLENLLNNSTYSNKQLEEAKKLIHFLCTSKITKYNLGIQSVTLPANSKGKKVILVPGQVDSDASIKFGSPRLRNNKELLAEVRKQHPDAYICYKPHPDILSGARVGEPLWPGIDEAVDFLIKDGDIISWIEAVDEVHTLTSTVGFEALLRQKPVFTYGLPFYAGWGLTTDWLHCERRTATRTLEELVVSVLLEYPTYLNPITGEYTTALNTAHLLADPSFSYDTRPLVINFIATVKKAYNQTINSINRARK